MRYYEEKGNKYIENGKSLVRVGLLGLQPSPLQEGRTVKIFDVVEVVKFNHENPLPRGAILAMSFPNEKVNLKEYKWYEGGWEECFLPFTISDKAVARMSPNLRPKVVEKEVRKSKASK